MYLHQLVAVALVASTPVAATSLSTRISINDGVIIGTTTTVPSATAVVNKYLGIPFAAPPERFSPPKPPCPWNHPLDASKFQATCTQQFDDMGPLRDLLVDVFNNPPLNESEDCLYINVYTPSSPTPEGGRAILAMIPGGAFQLGGAAQYDASALAAYEDIIVLSFNYRTNVFGFPSSPSLPPTQHNLGFLDQRLALSWIQNNIHFFGGDPEKVTITGGSAGAYSVDVLITSYPPNSHPPFRAALMQSGQYSFNAFPTDPSTSIQNWYNLTATLGCGNSTANGADLECVRKAPTAAIKEIIEQNILGFNPIPDNVTFFPNLAQRRAAGNFVRIPVISGTTAQEGRLFMYGFPFNVSTFIDTYFPEMDEGLKKEIEAAYPRGPGMETDYDIISQIYTEIVWQCVSSLCPLLSSPPLPSPPSSSLLLREYTNLTLARSPLLQLICLL